MVFDNVFHFLTFEYLYLFVYWILFCFCVKFNFRFLFHVRGVCSNYQGDSRTNTECNHLCRVSFSSILLLSAYISMTSGIYTIFSFKSTYCLEMFPYTLFFSSPLNLSISRHRAFRYFVILVIRPSLNLNLYPRFFVGWRRVCSM